MRHNPEILTVVLACCAVCAAPAARAQGIAGVRPARVKVEVLGGYSFMRSNTVGSSTRVNLNGASGSAAFFFKDWLSVVGDVGAYHQGGLAANRLSLNVVSYEAGPRVTMQNRTHLTPFAQALIGGGHAGGTLYTSSQGAGLPPLGASNGLALSAGGGADWALNPKVAIRVMQAEYLYTQFANGAGSNRQNSFRVSAGGVFPLGYYD